MRNIWEVARQEFMTHIRKPTFLWTAFGLPLFLIVIYALIFFVIINVSEEDFEPASIGYVDQAAVVMAADTAENGDLFTAFNDVDAANDALRAGDIRYYAVISSDYIQTGEVSLYAQGNVPDNLDNEVSDFLLASLAQRIDSNVSVERLSDPIDSTIYLENNGRELTENGIIGLIIAPTMIAMIIFLALQLASGFLMQGIVEEKSNRIVEMLITSIRPSELLAGKLLGSGGLGLVQVVTWGSIGVVLFAVAGSRFDALASVTIPPDLLVLGLVYFVLAYFLFGSVLAGIGAVVGSEQESRSIAGIITMIGVVPFFFVVQLLTEPNSPLVIALSLIPFTSPVTIMFRSAISTVPPEQLIASIGIMILSTIAIVAIAGRLFRWALLLYGKSISPKAILYALTGRAEMGTLPPNEATQTAKEQTA